MSVNPETVGKEPEATFSGAIEGPNSPITTDKDAVEQPEAVAKSEAPKPREYTMESVHQIIEEKRLSRVEADRSRRRIGRDGVEYDSYSFGPIANLFVDIPASLTESEAQMIFESYKDAPDGGVSEIVNLINRGKFSGQLSQETALKLIDNDHHNGGSFFRNIESFAISNPEEVAQALLHVDAQETPDGKNPRNVAWVLEHSDIFDGLSMTKLVDDAEKAPSGDEDRPASHKKMMADLITACVSKSEGDEKIALEKRLADLQAEIKDEQDKLDASSSRKYARPRPGYKNR